MQGGSRRWTQGRRRCRWRRRHTCARAARCTTGGWALASAVLPSNVTASTRRSVPSWYFSNAILLPTAQCPGGAAGGTGNCVEAIRSADHCGSPTRPRVDQEAERACPRHLLGSQTRSKELCTAIATTCAVRGDQCRAQQARRRWRRLHRCLTDVCRMRGLCAWAMGACRGHLDSGQCEKGNCRNTRLSSSCHCSSEVQVAVPWRGLKSAAVCRCSWSMLLS